MTIPAIAPPERLVDEVDEFAESSDPEGRAAEVVLLTRPGTVLVPVTVPGASEVDAMTASATLVLDGVAAVDVSTTVLVGCTRVVGAASEVMLGGAAELGGGASDEGCCASGEDDSGAGASLVGAGALDWGGATDDGGGAADDGD